MVVCLVESRGFVIMDEGEVDLGGISSFFYIFKVV